MFDQKANSIVDELCASGIEIADRKRFVFEVAEALKTQWHDLQERGKSYPGGEITAMELHMQKQQAGIPSTHTPLQSTKPDNLPVFNNIAGRGHGFNGLCSLPSKTDCLLAPIPFQPPPIDKYSRPIPLQSEPLPPWQSGESFNHLRQALPSEIKFSYIYFSLSHLRMVARWIIKTEPEAYSYSDLERDGITHWDGVRNYQADNNMKAMKVGDLCMVYHSISDKAMVGISRVVKEWHLDPTDKKGRFGMVDVVPFERFKKPVSLYTIRDEKRLSHIAFLKQTRLSVSPIDAKAWDVILDLSN